MGMINYNDPLTLLLMAEEDDEESDVLHSYWNAASHRAKTFEVERMTSDMLGASPFETNHPEFHL
jgi:hypothetical protein